tara:strand:- start:455 stop:1135 length:681 start_codon:yes stop_codon:yes gene_type:complete
MTLATSGAISLNEIHVEAGGTSGTTCSFNDTDIRGLTAASGKTINSTQGTTIDFDDFYGASSFTAASDVSTTMTVGGVASTSTTQYVGTTRTRFRGYDSSGSYDSSVTSFGSMAATSFTNYFGGGTITELFISGRSYSNVGIGGAASSGTLKITISSGNLSNSDASFKQMVVGSDTFNRSDATYSASSSETTWSWSVSGTPPDNNTSAFGPFGSSGTSSTITFKQA